MLTAITVTGNINLGSLGTFLAAVATLVGVFKANGKVNMVQAKVDDTHELVNGASERSEARIEQLSEAITATGATVPSRPTQPPAA